MPKGDRKRKKEVNAEIEKLEADLKQKHAKELAELKSCEAPDSVDEKVNMFIQFLSFFQSDIFSDFFI